MARRTVGCIGTGVMGSALMEAVAKSAGAGEILLRDSEPGKAESLAARLGCAVAGSNRELAKGARFVFLAVKPAYLAGVLDEIGPALTQDTVLVSMAAGVPIDFIKRHVDGHPRVVRIMPNMPASVGAGMIAVASGPSVPASDVEELLRLLAPAGLAEITGEALMDAVTAAEQGLGEVGRRARGMDAFRSLRVFRGDRPDQQPHRRRHGEQAVPAPRVEPPLAELLGARDREEFDRAPLPAEAYRPARLEGAMVARQGARRVRGHEKVGPKDATLALDARRRVHHVAEEGDLLLVIAHLAYDELTEVEAGAKARDVPVARAVVSLARGDRLADREECLKCP